MKIFCATLLISIGFLSNSAFAEEGEVVIVRRNSSMKGNELYSNQIISSKNLKDFKSLDDAIKLNSNAGLFRRSSNKLSNPTISGLNLRPIAPNGASRSLVNLEDIPLNDPFGNWVNFGAISNMALDDVRITKGASIVANSQSGILGLVELSLKPSNQFKNYLALDMGESGENAIAIGGAFLNSQIHYAKSKSIGDIGIPPNKRNIVDIAPSGSDESIILGHEGELCQSQSCPNFSILMLKYDGSRNANLLNAKSTISNEILGINLFKNANKDNLGYQLNLWQNKSDFSNISVSINSTRNLASIANTQFKTPANGNGLHFSLRKITGNFTNEIGADIRNLKGETHEYYRYINAAPTRLRQSGGKSINNGIFIQSNYSNNNSIFDFSYRYDVWKNSNGLRYEYDIIQNQNLLSVKYDKREYELPSMKFAYKNQINDNVAWRFSFYKAYRIPSLNELYRPFRVGNDVTEANENLVPELIKGVEFGLEQDFNFGLKSQSNVFFNIIENPIINKTIAIGPISHPIAGFIASGALLRQRVNIGSIEAIGFESFNQYKISSNMSLFFNLSLLKANLKNTNSSILEGNIPAQSPNYIVNMGVEKSYGDLNIAINHFIESSKFEDDLNLIKLERAQKTDIYLSYKLKQNISIYTQFYNVFNHKNEIAKTIDGLETFDKGRAMNFGIKIYN